MTRSLRPICLAFAAGAASTAALALLAAGPADPLATEIEQEPVLIHEVAGFGFGGPILERFSVYSDGLVTYGAGGFGFSDGTACFFYVEPEVVQQLAADIGQAGAFQISDEPSVVNDLPLTTATVFRSIGNGTARARTFSYFEPASAQAQAFAAVVQEFKASYVLPNACDGAS